MKCIKLFFYILVANIMKCNKKNHSKNKDLKNLFCNEMCQKWKLPIKAFFILIPLLTFFSLSQFDPDLREGLSHMINKISFQFI